MYRSVIKIDGMMCGMCESHINDVIRRNFKVKKVSSSHVKKQSIVISEEPISEEDVHKVIDPTGYKVLGFECGVEEKKSLFAKIFKK
ncbi:MAG: heavy metal-associated domain-containing protein [Bacillota bacterium]|nr:heavy metal-associated domain-containing protein [Bacillota bacterium]